ncbi:hypothetical protein C7974DRAFT_372351 [Boeremia exigua]|uniref:uncharacterized protein n=1 Tax=Boeremia exigua TaxID=749465 RepID=UPI001E8DD19D|nr:uncharacterized protein C7974DRAFT_372351 [Boeremia exigua]KAH6642414.1 hypothetical protein C7974DRAFT_372351 [Boeremia exigua]
MPFTEFVIPTLKTDPETEATFLSELAPYLIEILDTHANPPKAKNFGKILIENGKDVSKEFRLSVGLEWNDDSHFNSFVASDNFAAFKTKVFGSALTEVWQVKLGEGDAKLVESQEAWRKFVAAVAAADAQKEGTKSIHGPSLNLEERRWVGVLGWDDNETREKVLASAAVKEAKEGLDALVWNTFVTTFAQ